MLLAEVVGFCAMLTSGDADFSRCIWTERDLTEYTEHAECHESALVTKDLMITYQTPRKFFLDIGYTGPMVYFAGCLNEDQLRQHHINTKNYVEDQSI